jgi:ACS family tartrate transporter-like MFS transporter
MQTPDAIVPAEAQFEPAEPRLDPTAARGLRKASWRLLPLIALGYGTAYMDRVNISFASLQMNRDLHFSNTVYGLGAGLFFLSYAACEVPSNLLLYRFGARRWLARIMVTWGVIAMAMIFVRTPWQFYGARFLLGMAEAGFFPGVVFYLMQWFPPEQRARSISRFYIAAPLSSVFMGVVAGALLNLQGRLHLAGWQWLFLVEAVPAVVLGVVFYLYLPDGPGDAAWLSEGERVAIVSGVQRVPASPHGDSVLHALGDPRVWLLGLFMFCMLATNYAYTFSTPDILRSVSGYSITKIGFLIAAINLLGAFAMIGNGWWADRSSNRSSGIILLPFWHVIPCCLMMAAGLGALAMAASAIVAIPALLLVVLGNYGMQGPLWAVASSFLSGRSAAAAIAAMNTIGILGGFIGPSWMGFARDLTGNYQRGLLTMTVPMLGAAAIMLYLRGALAMRYATAANPVPSLP